MLSLSLLSLALIGILIGGAYGVVLAIYRLFFSPISHFPGPKLAAATFWYQFYYDVVLQGQYVWKTRELHEKYGPVVRINPYEIHINDPAFIDEIYPGPGSHKRDKWEFATKGLGIPGATLTTNPHDHHKVRRSALNPFFSKAAVRKLEPLMDLKMGQLIERLEEFQKSGDVLILNHAFAALTNGKDGIRFGLDVLT
jgi:cytochrome P450